MLEQMIQSGIYLDKIFAVLPGKTVPDSTDITV